MVAEGKSCPDRSFPIWLSFVDLAPSRFGHPYQSPLSTRDGWHQKSRGDDPRPIRESLQSTHPSLSTAHIPTPPSRLDPYPRKRPITSRFPIDIATLPDLATDSSDCTTGPTAPTDVTLRSCPSSLPLLYSPDSLLTESRLSRVQCSVLLVVPEFRTVSLFNYLPFPTFGYCSLSVFTFAPLSYSIFPFTTLPSRSDSRSTYSSSRYFAHFPCSLFGLPYVRLVFRVPFPHVPLGP